jgi:peptidoglycan/xylan/chitin deacetylase (PgdA/CDA1 family)
MTELIAYALWILGIPTLVRAINRHKVAILLYHDPDPAVFDAHLGYLRKRYNIIPFRRAVEALTTGNWSDLPPHAIVIHIDDGYRRNIQLAMICERHQVEPTLYLCSHVIGTHRRFWSKLADGRSKHLRLVKNNQLLAKLRDEANYTPETEYESRAALSTAELAAMAPHFDFQSHGRYHFSLLTLDDAELSNDLEESHARIEKITGQSCKHFSFPYGDYSAREISAVKRAGYKTARTTRPGWINPHSDPYQLPIIADVPGTLSINQLRLQLTGVPRFTKRLTYMLVTKHIYALRQRILMSRRFF